MSEQPKWVPNTTPQHPPFEGGNTMSLHHGAWSPRKVDPLALELVTLMVEDPSLGYLAAPAFRLAVWGWARAEAQVQLLTEYLEHRGKGGVGDLADERINRAYLLLHRAEARALSGRRALGLDPLSRARLGKDIAQGAAADAATVLTTWRAQIEAGERAASSSDGDDDGA